MNSISWNNPKFQIALFEFYLWKWNFLGVCVRVCMSLCVKNCWACRKSYSVFTLYNVWHVRLSNRLNSSNELNFIKNFVWIGLLLMINMFKQFWMMKLLQVPNARLKFCSCERRKSGIFGVSLFLTLRWIE